MPGRSAKQHRWAARLKALLQPVEAGERTSLPMPARVFWSMPPALLPRFEGRRAPGQSPFLSYPETSSGTLPGAPALAHESKEKVYPRGTVQQMKCHARAVMLRSPPRFASPRLRSPSASCAQWSAWSMSSPAGCSTHPLRAFASSRASRLELVTPRW